MTSHTFAAKLLSSEEDVFFLHKLLGLSCLISFVTRFSRIGEQDMGFDSASVATPLTILLHLLLSLSSLLFEIPSKRMGGKAFRIWPEYRLHSIAFASRSLALMAVTYFNMVNDIPECLPTHAMVTLVVLATCKAADLGSNLVGESNRSNTIRDLGTHPAVRYIFSVFQIYATAGCLYEQRRYSYHFVIVFIIQFNAFLMTLQRKNVASHGIGVALYALMLVFGACVTVYEIVRTSTASYFMISSFANIAVILRFGIMKLDKYVLWTMVACLLHWARPFEEDPAWFSLYATTMSILVLLGCHKVFLKQEYDREGGFEKSNG